LIEFVIVQTAEGLYGLCGLSMSESVYEQNNTKSRGQIWTKFSGPIAYGTGKTYLCFEHSTGMGLKGL